MTREEAIEILKTELYYDEKVRITNTGWERKSDEAHLMAIKALSQEQKSESVTEFADRCRECGKMRKGHWIYDETIENWRCSKCNETPKTMGYVGTADFMAEHFEFCNHCGAKMENVENL